LADRQENVPSYSENAPSLLGIKHYWVEFWLDGMGWIPLDPALGAGAAPRDFALGEAPGRYYFGNLDNQHIAFSRGEHFLNQMTPRGRTVRHRRDYSLQNLWEEAVGDIKSYSSVWSDVTIAHIEEREEGLWSQ
jgi:transglutaminase-like putative cysteine protease